MKQELNFDGHGINLKEFDEQGECSYCERVATLQPRFKGHGIGKLLAMAMLQRDSLGVVSDALDRLKVTNGPFSVDLESAHTLAKAMHQSAQSVYTGDRD